MLVALLVAHVVGDWMLQTHAVASTKTTDVKIRAWHCFVYCLPVAALIFLVLNPIYASIALAWAYMTHFIIDSYMPLYYFRKAMGDPEAESVDSFKQAFATPKGFYINVTLDQMFHFLTLVPVAIAMALF